MSVNGSMTGSGLVEHLLDGGLERSEPSLLRVRDLSGPIGSVVEGCSLDSMGDAELAELRALIAARHVVFIPGQDLDEVGLRGLAERFGPLAVHPVQRILGRDRVVSTIEDSPGRPPAGFPWHTDLSWLAAPPRFGFLHALEIPGRGGDTMWASMTAAHRALSPSFQDLVASLSAVHRIDTALLDSIRRHHGDSTAAEVAAAHPPVRHPLVRTHPDTGEASLYLSPMYVERIDDLLPDESRMLLAHLESVINDPNLAVRWRWSPGDLAIWDESTTVHRALIDHHPSTRRMRRCTVEGSAVKALFPG